MVKVLLNGCLGKMGQAVEACINSRDDVLITVGVDIAEGNKTYPVYNCFVDVQETPDVIVDFSAAAAVDQVMEYATAHKIPLVECTTGLSEDQLARLEDCSRQTAVLRSANMSLGVNTLLKLVGVAARVLARSGFDMEIVEKHHRRKLDAPSGTALALADAIKEAMEEDYDYIYNRSDRRMRRPEKEIGISAVRGGTIVGDHDVIFAGTDEVVELKHTAYSRAIFGKGAIAAARFLADKEAGMYSMKDVIG